MVAYGEELPVVDDTLDGWVAVSYDGETLYVSADYVTVDEKLKTALNMTEVLYGEGVSDVRVSLCEYAKQFLGNLIGEENGVVTVEVDGSPIRFEKNEIALVRLRITL